jgi:hypothetical protein
VRGFFGRKKEISEAEMRSFSENNDANGQLKALAATAKQRMKNGYWQKAKRERSEAVSESEGLGKDPKAVENYLVKKVADEMNAQKNALSRAEEELYRKVCAMLDENIDVTNPIARLIDRRVYDSLEPNERQRYVLVLMFKYSELKERYHRERALYG